MTDSKIAFYSGVLQVIPVLLLAVALNGRRLHPNIASRRRFTAPGWALAIGGAAAAAMAAAAVALYADLDALPIDLIIAAVMLILIVGLLGTAFEIAKSVIEEQYAHGGDESSGTHEGVDTGL